MEAGKTYKQDIKSLGVDAALQLVPEGDRHVPRLQAHGGEYLRCSSSLSASLLLPAQDDSLQGRGEDPGHLSGQEDGQDGGPEVRVLPLHPNIAGHVDHEAALYTRLEDDLLARTDLRHSWYSWFYALCPGDAAGNFLFQQISPPEEICSIVVLYCLLLLLCPRNTCLSGNFIWSQRRPLERRSERFTGFILDSVEVSLQSLETLQTLRPLCRPYPSWREVPVALWNVLLELVEEVGGQGVGRDSREGVGGRDLHQARDGLRDGGGLEVLQSNKHLNSDISPL